MSWEMIRPFLEPISYLLDDPEVSEIEINPGGSPIFAQRQGRASEDLEDVSLEPDKIKAVLMRIARPQGNDVDEFKQPILDASFPDGSRIGAIVGPSTPDGYLMTIRKFRPVDVSLAEMVGQGILDGMTAGMLSCCVTKRKNILISGGTWSGKTTTLKALLDFIPSSQRLIIIEDTVEIRPPYDQHPNQVRLRCTPAVNGSPGVTATQLLKAALRHHPSRIILGEIRGAEAWDLLNLLNTGHPGTLCTLHADSPVKALSRFENCVLMATAGLPHEVIQLQIGDAIEVVAHMHVREEEGKAIRRLEVLRVDGYDVQERRYRFKKFPQHGGVW